MAGSPVHNPRGGLPQGETFDRTDFAFADRYLPERRIPRYERIRVKFPFIEDRSALFRIPFESDELHRSWRGEIPKIPIDFNHLTIIPPFNLARTQYLFHSTAQNVNNVPQGYYGTSSGIFPVDFVPFSIGEPTEKAVIINLDYNADSTISGEFYFILHDNRQKIRESLYYPQGYYPNDPASLGVMMEWQISPDFQMPVSPQLRYPNQGAFKRKGVL